MLEHLNPTQKGDLAEAGILTELCRLGYEIVRPCSAGARYDLGVVIGPRIIRIQCKLAKLNGPRKQTPSNPCWPVVDILTCSSNRGKTPKQDYRNSCDLIAAYCPNTKECYGIIPNGSPRTIVRLRLAAPKNNQSAGVRLANDYSLVGALAQLGERDAGSVEVAGSSPARSIPRIAM